MTSSKSTEHKFLRSERLYSLRYTTVQSLKPDDCPKRVDFCEWLLQQQNTDKGFIAIFCGLLKHVSLVMRYLIIATAICGPRSIRMQSGRRDIRNVGPLRVGRHTRGCLLGPYLFPERLLGQSYLVFLNEVLTEFLDDIPLAVIQEHWFQHDGAPAHFCAPVRDFMLPLHIKALRY
ncbi:uncharacterized protein TNCV_616431 [Trichonephila clavipes]|nr:uncharacterized protein TNCV_616431 [Trichonephila clavipes]